MVRLDMVRLDMVRLDMGTADIGTDLINAFGKRGSSTATLPSLAGRAPSL
jgi:hypothetical protein